MGGEVQSRLSRRLVAVWGLSALMLLTAGIFVAAQVLVPGDQAVILVDERGSSTELSVLVRAPAAGGLRSGDIVLAINGRRVDDWIRGGLSTPFDAAARSSEQLTYQVRREGETLTLTPALTRLPMGPALRETWSYFVFFTYLLAVGTFLLIRRPNLPAARALMLLASAIASSSVVFFLGLRPSDLRMGWLFLLYVWSTVPLFGLLAAGLLHFTLVFPAPQPLFARRPWLAPLLYLGVWVPYAGFFFAGWDPAAPPTAQFLRVEAATIGMTAAYFPLAVAAAIFVYRRTTEAHLRRQLRWIVWGIVAAIGPWLALSTGPQLFGRESLLPSAVVGLLWCLIPTTIAIAILREGLFDIDVLINRTLVYGALSAVLAGVYFGAVIVLQAAVRAVTGEGRSPLVTVLSTLLIAALAAPLRRRVQGFIDRRFYRRKYDAAQTLAAFGAVVRDEVNLEALEARLLAVVEDTMQPARADLWMPGQGRAAPVRNGGRNDPVTMAR